MNSEIDVNLLVTVYNERINALYSQNILLEARLKSLIRDCTEEKNKLMMANLELQRQLDVLSDNPASKKILKDKLKEESSDYEE
jgi:hypothetical protein